MSTTPALEPPANAEIPAWDVGRSLSAVIAELQSVRSSDRSDASDEERLAWVDQIREIERRATALGAMLVAEADQADSALRARRTPMPNWLARSGQQTPRQAAGALWAGRALAQRPRVFDMATAGQISMAQAKAIGEALDGLPATLDTGQKQQAESIILREAQHRPAEDLRRMTEKLVAQVAPERIETPEQGEARLAARDGRAAARRSLRFGEENDGSLEFNGSLPVVEGHQLRNLIRTLVDRSYRAAKDARDRNALSLTPQQRAADALMVVVGAMGAHENGSRWNAEIPAGAAQINVLISQKDLLKRAVSHATLEDGTPLSAGALRLLACSAELIPVVLDTDSTVLDVGRAVRLAPPPLRRAIGLRDGGCAFPGCRAPMHQCEVHHITPWQQGGPTNRDNVVALCKVHHALIEPAPPEDRGDGVLRPLDQWTVRIDGRGLPEFQPPRALDPDRRPISRQNHAATLLDTG